MSKISSLLKEAANEITNLRNQNRVLGEKMWLVENLLELRHLHGPSQGMAPDIVYDLRDEAGGLEKQEAEAQSKAMPEL